MAKPKNELALLFDSWNDIEHLMEFFLENKDDLQEYLDRLADEQPEQKSLTRAADGDNVTIPIGLTEIDLSKFSSYQSRSKVRQVYKWNNHCLVKFFWGDGLVKDLRRCNGCS